MSVSLLLTLAYTFHIVEEYHFNWLKWTQFFIVNACVIVFGITCTILGYSYPIISYTFAGLSIINAVFAHIGVTILKHKFLPCLITSILLFIPFSR